MGGVMDAKGVKGTALNWPKRSPVTLNGLGKHMMLEFDTKIVTSLKKAQLFF